MAGRICDRNDADKENKQPVALREALPATPQRKFRLLAFKEKCRCVYIAYRRMPVQDHHQQQEVQFAACIFSGERDANGVVQPLPAGFYSRREFKAARAKTRQSAVERFVRVPRMVAVPANTSPHVLRYILRYCLLSKHGCYGTRRKPGMKLVPKQRSMDRVFKMMARAQRERAAAAAPDDLLVEKQQQRDQNTEAATGPQIYVEVLTP